MTQSQHKVHFIAIGGSVMHNMAIALHLKGLKVTGSDDIIAEPSNSRLAKHGLLPETMGWNPDKITSDLDAIILGMHARTDNPELLKAQELGLKIYSFPEYVYEQSQDKQRIVIAGSHGKTTITSMIMHVLNFHKREFDYLVGAKLEGFETMVKLTDAPIIVIEGDEYLSSPLDSRPKFLHYHHHIGLVSGVAWDHINVFPTLDSYVRQFDHFADSTPKGGTLIYSEDDDLAAVICKKERDDVMSVGYTAHKSEVINGKTYLINENQKVEIQVFGEHNMRNLNGAKTVCSRIGITDDMFYEAIGSFKGAANRLELLAKNDNTIVFKDFAHAPSKLQATCKAVKSQFPDRELIACLELHTFSSLNKDFLSQYNNAFTGPDTAIVYYDEEVLKHKRLELLNPEEVKSAFNRNDLQVITDPKKLEELLLAEKWKNKNLLLMSSGTFSGTNLKSLAEKVISKQ